jgi:hypothetical protein
MNYDSPDNPDLQDEAERLRQQYREWLAALGAKDLAFDYGAENIDLTQIPPRGWLLGNWWCRQFVSSLIGVGAGGKTAVRIACALSLATARKDIIGEHVFERVPVLYLCFEDGKNELIRRIGAAQIRHHINNQDLAGYLFVNAVNNLKFASEGEFGKLEVGPLYDKIAAFIKAKNIGMVILDPLIKTHSVNENSNSHMDFVSELLSRLAIEANVGVDAPQHVRKGGIDPGDAEAGRGASATKDASRLGYTIVPMAPEEAKAFGLDPNTRHQFVRIDSAKVNIAPKAQFAKWLKLVGVELGNKYVNPLYPSGDTVQTVEAWSPPDVFDGLTAPLLWQIFNRLRQEPTPGECWRAHPNANELWVGTPIAFIANIEKGQARLIVKKWIEKGVLLEQSYKSPKRNNSDTRCLHLNEIKAAEMTRGYYPADGEPDSHDEYRSL